jgi:hypothetical protein
MLLIMVLASHSMPITISPDPCDCRQLDQRYFESLVERVEESIYITPDGLQSLGNLVKYWKSTCPKQRFAVSRSTVKKLSHLLARQPAILPVSSMLVDIGPNLRASRSDVNAAIKIQTAREDAAFMASSPIRPTTGRIVSYSLRCVREKMSTGRLDWRYCSYIRYTDSSYSY